MNRTINLCLSIIAASLLTTTMAMADEQPFRGTPSPIPGIVQAENYDTGGQGVGYSVTTVNGTTKWYRRDGVNIESCSDFGGYDLGWSAAGQWFRYTVTVSSAGKYVVGFRVASESGGGALHLQSADGTNLTGKVEVPGTGGWQDWVTKYVIVTLPAGRQVLTLVQDAGGFNINNMVFDEYNRIPPPPTGLIALAGNARTTLMWSGANGAMSYSVYRGTKPGREDKTAIATDITSPNYTDTGLANGVRYFYKVATATFDHTSKRSNEAEATPGDPVSASTPDFGPNVLIFDPSMPAATVQSQLDTIFGEQQANDFSAQRYAVAFKPGSYNLTVKIGFYTQVLGLGQSPDDTTITGAVQADADWMQKNATLNFWRSVENLAVVPTQGPSIWAVSQGCSFRRMHVKGSLNLSDGGWSSGGFMSDSLIDAKVDSGTQQQWLSRNSQWGSWTGSNWNMVFVGVDGAPSGAFPKPPYTVVDQTPVVREKPFLTIDSSGHYSVLVPSTITNSHGTSWAHGSTPGKSLPISQFYIARQGTDTSTTINAALSQGKDLLLTPGIYDLKDPIRVTRANTVVLGLGLATLRPRYGASAMEVSDVDGVDISGILFDAGPVSSPTLLQVGPKGSSLSHSANPTCLHDLYFRVGGGAVGQADVSLEINSNNVIGDNFWLWRADHRTGVGWDVNVAANGLVVNGADVTIYSLAVEHYQKYQTVWNGNGGEVYLYQSEIPYDVPSDGSWMNGSVTGYASYKVSDSVTSHKAWGLGIYCVFRNRDGRLSSAIEAPNSPGVKFIDMTAVSIGGRGTITHVINDTGGAADHSSSVATLNQYP